MRNRRTHISIIGTFDSEYDGHLATREAVVHAERELGAVLNTRWVTPDELGDPIAALDRSCGALVACRNPKHLRRLMPEVLAALTHLRALRLPVLGIECGYQHMLIESARETLGRPEANSTAYDEDTPLPVIRELDPDAVTARPMRRVPTTFRLEPGTRLAEIHGGAGEVVEAFRSAYAANSDYVGDLTEAGVRFSAHGVRGERLFPAALERADLPFWVGVAYLPQFASRPQAAHPLFTAFVRAALERARGDEL